MRKLLLAAAAVLTLTSAANAEVRVRLYDGQTIASSCYRSIYAASGWMCRTWWNGTGNSARVLHVPETMEFNANTNWGKRSDELPSGCRSCADLSK